MFARLTTFVALATVVVASAGQARSETPGNPPRILVASSIDSAGNLMLVSYRTIYIGFDGSSYNDRTLHRVALKNVKIHTVDGKEVSIESARKLLAEKETPILATSWSAPIPPFFRKLFTDKAMVFVFPQDAPSWREIQDPGRPLG